MAKREVITLPSAQVEVEERPDHLFVVESGQLRGMGDLRRYHQAIDAVIRRTGKRAGVIDARGEIGDPPAEVRDAMWAWLLDPQRGFETVAFVLPTEMAVARVNMTALSRRAQVRAFDSVFAAQRWLARGPRFSTQASVGGQRSSSRPPAPTSTEVERDRKRGVAYAPTQQALPAQPSSPATSSSATPPRRPSSPGAYHTTSTQTERPGPIGGPGTYGLGTQRDDEPEASGRRESDFRTKRPVAGGEKKGGGGSQVA